VVLTTVELTTVDGSTAVVAGTGVGVGVVVVVVCAGATVDELDELAGGD
jgi:uncharacterized protein (DUF433 family)